MKTRAKQQTARALRFLSVHSTAGGEELVCAPAGMRREGILEHFGGLHKEINLSMYD